MWNPVTIASLVTAVAGAIAGILVAWRSNSTANSAYNRAVYANGVANSAHTRLDFLANAQLDEATKEVNDGNSGGEVPEGRS